MLVSHDCMVDVETKLAELVEGTSRTLDWAKAEFEDALEQVEQRSMEELDEDTKAEFALGIVESDRIFKDRVGRRGDEMEIEILAIGQAGRIENWGQDDETVVYSYGFIYGPLGSDGDYKAAKAVMINIAERGMDLDDVQQKYHALNTMKAVYSVDKSSDLDNVFQCWATESTELVETELDNLPATREEKLEILRAAIPEAKLATLREDMSKYDPDSGYTYDFGADLRRIQGKIVDYYYPDDRSWGRYTIMDDSVTEDDLEEMDEIFDSEDSNIPGLTVWADPNYHMEYGRSSRCDFYGTVEEGSNGNLVMNLVGVVPIIPMPMDDEESADENANAKESSI